METGAAVGIDEHVGNLRSPRESVTYEIAKRIIDLVLGTVMLVAAVPVMLVAAVLIKVTSRGPVLFKQQRAGLNHKPFTMYKFRTMYEGAEDDRE